jgi:hypothetical protein
MFFGGASINVLVGLCIILKPNQKKFNDLSPKLAAQDFESLFYCTLQRSDLSFRLNRLLGEGQSDLSYDPKWRFSVFLFSSDKSCRIEMAFGFLRLCRFIVYCCFWVSKIVSIHRILLLKTLLRSLSTMKTPGIYPGTCYGGEH